VTAKRPDPGKSQKPVKNRASIGNSDSLRWVIEHPVIALIGFTVICLLIVALFYSLFWWWPLSGRGLPINDLFGNASALIEATIGTAVVAASAFVAIVIATSAARTAELANKINDPDYLAAKAALRSYQKYVFVMGGLLAIYRSYRHEAELQYDHYQSEKSELNQSSGTEHSERCDLGPPPWDRPLSELQELLFDTDFLSVLHELAHLQDESIDPDCKENAESHVQKLRSNVSQLASTVERYLAPREVHSPSFANSVLFHLMARAAMLSGLVRELVRDLKNNRHLFHQQSNSFPTLKWFSEWIEQIPDVEVDRDFSDLVRQELPEFRLVDKDTPYSSISDQIRKLMAKTYEDASFPVSYRGDPQKEMIRLDAHSASLVKTLIGDQSTVFRIEQEARRVAKSLGMNPVIHHNRMVGDRKENQFDIIYCLPGQIGRLFGAEGIRPNTRGCVIIDGMRSLSPVALSPTEQKMLNEGKYSITIYDFVDDLLKRALDAGLRENESLSYPAKDYPEKDEGPRIMWIGIDYRPFSKAPEDPDLDQYQLQPTAIFSRALLLMGEDPKGLISYVENAVDR